MTTQGMGAAMLLDGATDDIAFETYVAQFLVATLVPGKIVVMDTLSHDVLSTYGHVRLAAPMQG